MIESEEGKYITSTIEKTFICPHCHAEFENNKFYYLHLEEQHPEQTKYLNKKALNNLQDYKDEKTNILNF